MNSYKLIRSIFLFISILSLFLVFAASNNLRAQTREVVVVYFEPDIEGIGPGNKEKVKEGIKNLRNVDEYTVILEGYSDITGRADYNLKLSRERAQLVKDYLLELGLDSNKIEVIGKGGTDKYAQGEADEALARNRRVNLIIEIPTQPAVEEEVPEVQDAAQDDQSQIALEEAEDEISSNTSNIQTPQIELDDISEKIENAIRQSASKGILFSSPKEMKMGEIYKVEAEVSSSFVEELSKNLDGFKLGDQVGLILTGNGVKISDTEMIVKTLHKDIPTIWDWEVGPVDIGLKSLILSVSISSQSTVLDDKYPAYIRIFEVKPNMIHSITSSYWVMGVLIVLIILIVAWILLRRVKVN